MTDKVDLTLDRVFSRPIRSKTISSNRKFMWDYSGYYDDIYYANTSPILLGNKEQRAKQKEIRIANSPDYCDCCGKRMHKIPWIKEIGVCKKCKENYENDKLNKKQRCPWRKETYFSILLDTISVTQTRLNSIE